MKPPKKKKKREEIVFSSRRLGDRGSNFILAGKENSDERQRGRKRGAKSILPPTRKAEERFEFRSSLEGSRRFAIFLNSVALRIFWCFHLRARAQGSLGSLQVPGHPITEQWWGALRGEEQRRWSRWESGGFGRGRWSACLLPSTPWFGFPLAKPFSRTFISVRGCVNTCVLGKKLGSQRAWQFRS